MKMIRKIIRMIGLLLMLITHYPAQADDTELDAIPTLLRGELNFTGSIALNNLLSILMQAFSDRHSLVSVALVDSGSEGGIAALINGSADMALTSTPLTDKQKSDFVNRFGYPPTVIPIAKDAVAVYVNNLNPLGHITIQELDAIFSGTLRCSDNEKPITLWGQLGVTGLLAKRSIHVYGLTVNTGATRLFRRVALCGGDLIRKFKALPGAAAIEMALSSDYSGIAFSNSMMKSSTLHALAISQNKDAPPILPTPGNIRADIYPMSRTLSIVVNKSEQQRLKPELRAFIAFARSEEGRDMITKAGYVTLPH